MVKATPKTLSFATGLNPWLWISANKRTGVEVHPGCRNGMLVVVAITVRGIVDSSSLVAPLSVYDWAVTPTSAYRKHSLNK